ncbi:MAG: YdgA family protein [Gammaproteobacteria bacterium]|nr:YdgA family protein [Gammaproteobacteria bacterium]MCW8840674.1 YdgA family protein [Gammaproteobacteria bacterium]MCW8958412.1 YdgA family protein [Gammaproteobacteria bacterium]MCW8973088.1 YdgA family protein [Gammaproteobacteria bacterium]MCW8993227.1 YdgA family protein [Gammaproteobacteria bacterium]
MKKFLIAGVVVIGGAVLAAPYLIGTHAEGRFTQGHEWLQQEILYPQVSVQPGEYRKGWLTSETSTRFSFTPAGEGEAPLSFELVHHINQIPSPMGMMRIESELALPPEMAEKLEGHLRGGPLLSAETVVGFDGNATTTLTSPGYSGPLQSGERVQLDWRGLEGTFNSDGKMGHITASLTAPGLSIKDGEGSVTLSRMHYNTDLVRGAYDLWFGTADATLEGIEFDVETPENGPARMQMSKARLTTEQHEDDTRVDIDGKLTFETFEVNGFNVSDGIYEVAYHNLDAASLGQLNTTLKQIMHEQPQDPSLLVDSMKSHVQGLLSQKPELSIRQLRIETPMGTVSGKLHMVLTDPLTDAMMQNPIMLMDILRVDLDASLPKPMVMGLLSSSARNSVTQIAKTQGRSLSSEEVTERSNALMQQQLQGLLAQQLMVEQGENYLTSIHYARHKLMINDQDATPMIGALLQ